MMSLFLSLDLREIGCFLVTRIVSPCVVFSLILPLGSAGAMELPKPTASLPDNVTTMIKFKKTPDRVVQITKSRGDRFFFSSCTLSSGRVSGCSSVGHKEGYSKEQLERRWKKMRRKVWWRRLVTIPAGAFCGSLLMGGIALMDLWPLLKASGHFVEAGLSHMMSAPVEIPQGMLEGMQKGGEVAGPLGAVGGVLPGAVKGTLMSQAKMSIGMLEGAMGLAFGYMGAFMIATYATIGGAIGLPATWLTLKVFRPPFARASRSIKPAVSQDFEYEEMLLRSSADRFISDLEFALSDIPLEID